MGDSPTAANTRDTERAYHGIKSQGITRSSYTTFNCSSGQRAEAESLVDFCGGAAYVTSTGNATRSVNGTQQFFGRGDFEHGVNQGGYCEQCATGCSSASSNSNPSAS